MSDVARGKGANRGAFVGSISNPKEKFRAKFHETPKKRSAAESMVWENIPSFP